MLMAETLAKLVDDKTETLSWMGFCFPTARRIQRTRRLVHLEPKPLQKASQRDWLVSGRNSNGCNNPWSSSFSNRPRMILNIDWSG